MIFFQIDNNIHVHFGNNELTLRTNIHYCKSDYSNEHEKLI